MEDKRILDFQANLEKVRDIRCDCPSCQTFFDFHDKRKLKALYNKIGLKIAEASFVEGGDG